jgi:hypothetical protein
MRSVALIATPLMAGSEFPTNARGVALNRGGLFSL